MSFVYKDNSAKLLKSNKDGLPFSFNIVDPLGTSNFFQPRHPVMTVAPSAPTKLLPLPPMSWNRNRLIHGRLIPYIFYNLQGITLASHALLLSIPSLSSVTSPTLTSMSRDHIPFLLKAHPNILTYWVLNLSPFGKAPHYHRTSVLDTYYTSLFASSSLTKRSMARWFVGWGMLDWLDANLGSMAAFWFAIWFAI